MKTIINFRVTSEEKRILEEVAAANGLSMTEVFRRFLYAAKRYGVPDARVEISPPAWAEKDLDELRAKIRELMPILRERYCVESLELFGSYVRGEQRPDSDLDVLVEFSENPGLRFGGLVNFLEDELGVKVDLVLRKKLKPRLQKQILQEAVAV